MNIFTQTVVVVGRQDVDKVTMLGTGFLISNDCKIVTSKHVVGLNDSNLVIILPHIQTMESYQDTTDTSCKVIPVKILDIDPIKDICIIKAGGSFDGDLPKIGSFDDVKVGEKLGIFGFPHCVEGRKVLTYQSAELGAKILLDANSIKTKHGVMNIQSRPGQSGSMVYSLRNNEIVGILIGAYAPEGGGISLGGINPRELHQTTHCISAEYIKEMI